MPQKVIIRPLIIFEKDNPHNHHYRVEKALGREESIGEQCLESSDQFLLRVDHIPSKVSDVEEVIIV